MDNTKLVADVREAFLRILEATDSEIVAKDPIGTQRRETVLSAVASGEEAAAFDELIYCLDEYDVVVSDQTKKDLVFLAGAMGKSDGVGKGKYR
jgi:hypothetical protein